MTAPGDEAWLLYGCRSSYAPEVAEIVWRLGGTVRLVDNMTGPPMASTVAPVTRSDELDRASLVAPVAVPLLTPGHRHAAEADARQRGLRNFRTLLDPSSVVASTSTLEEGTIVNAGVVIGALGTIGRFVQVNRSASVGHHVVLGDFVTLGPACVLAGHVTVEPGAFLGAGAVLAPEITVGANAIVGAGAVVVADVRPGTTVVGNPARVVRESGVGWGGVSVPPRVSG
jgi:sugar O-acyltransferase (sialic acid O-acetyltransferase NeuD family)